MRVVNFIPPRKELRVSISYGAARAPEPVWTQLRIEISLIIYNELERMWKEAVVSEFKVLCQHLIGRT
jgi:hypothetical protein